MKQSKKPTRKQKIILSQARLNPDNWLVVKASAGQLHLMNRETGRKRVISYG